MAPEAVPAGEGGEDQRGDLGDGVHPYDAGHQLYAEAVARAMEQLRGVGEPGPHALGEPFRKGDFEFARPMPLHRAELSPGWRKLHLVNDPAVRQMRERIEFGDKLLALWVTGEVVG